MVNIGNPAQCPQCAQMGRVVWISQSGKIVGIQCSKSHRLESLPNAYGFSRAPSKANKNSVFLVNTESL
jgi:hypothetical protein